jgi:hypothetical protein
MHELDSMFTFGGLCVMTLPSATELTSVCDDVCHWWESNKQQLQSVKKENALTTSHFLYVSFELLLIRENLKKFF